MMTKRLAGGLAAGALTLVVAAAAISLAGQQTPVAATGSDHDSGVCSLPSPSAALSAVAASSAMPASTGHDLASCTNDIPR